MNALWHDENGNGNKSTLSPKGIFKTQLESEDNPPEQFWMQ